MEIEAGTKDLNVAPREALRTGIAKAKRLGQVTLVFLAISGLVEVGRIGAGFWQVRISQAAAAGRPVGLDAVTSGERVYRSLDDALTGVCVATTFFWFLWIYRSYTNLRLLGTGKTRYSPGWAVGYWFAPIINLLAPYWVVRELWVRSATANASEELGPAPPIVGLWWVVWASAAVVFRWHPLPGGLTLAVTGVATDALALFAVVLTAVVVHRVSGFQSRTWSPPRPGRPAFSSRLEGSAFSEAPPTLYLLGGW
jgi:hypothetical protein